MCAYLPPTPSNMFSPVCVCPACVMLFKNNSFSISPGTLHICSVKLVSSVQMVEVRGEVVFPCIPFSYIHLIPFGAGGVTERGSTRMRIHCGGKEYLCVCLSVCLWTRRRRVSEKITFPHFLPSTYISMWLAGFFLCVCMHACMYACIGYVNAVRITFIYPIFGHLIGQDRGR